MSGRQFAAMNIRAQIEDALDAVTNPDEDRILRLYVHADRSDAAHELLPVGDRGRLQRKPYLSFKLDSQKIKELPLPRPLFEIFVYSPAMEGIHLRAGKVARGGIRWSDRREDFRTEILGLMKAQNVKNVVIVPMGSKGGFVVKNPSSDRADVPAGRGGVLQDAAPRHARHHRQPPRRGRASRRKNVVRRDGDDPYLVVAADKGTATFSDIANSSPPTTASGSATRSPRAAAPATTTRPWASRRAAGGKRSSATSASSARTSQTRTSPSSASATCRATSSATPCSSRRTSSCSRRSTTRTSSSTRSRSGRGLAERQRMFDQRLNWNAYNRKLLSKGGGGPSSAAQNDDRLDGSGARCSTCRRRRLAPADLIKAILRARADLLWLGGIGTYVKASDEDQAAARDRANDALRVERQRAARPRRRRRSEPRLHPACPHRVRAGRREDQHRRHRQLGRRRHLRPRSQHQDPAVRRDRARRAEGRKSATSSSRR